MTEETRNKGGALGFTVALLALLLPLAFAAPLADWPAQLQLIRSWFAGTGHAAPAIFTVLAVAGTAVGMPRLIFCALGGMLFGFTWGFVWSHLGTLLGAYLAFLFARHTARGYLLQRYPRLRGLADKVEGTGWWAVVLVRQMPISGLYNDFLLALSPVNHRDFWIGTTLGFLPLGITTSMVGAGAMQADLGTLGQYFTLAAISFLLLNWSWKWLVARARRENAA